MRPAAGRAAPAAIVFDADGLLIDTEPAWVAARGALYARHGAPFGPGERQATLGTGVSGTARRLSVRLGDGARAGELTAELLDLLVAEVARATVHPLPGAAALVDELTGRISLAVASNSPRALLERTLEAAGFAGRFDVVLGVDEVARPKPAPDLYLRAVERLGARPEDSVAVEDSPAGVASARSAGLYVIGIPSAAGVALDAGEIAASLGDPALRGALGLPSRTAGQP